MEPITTTIVAAIALGASQGMKETAAQAVKDSWATMKIFIQDRYKDNEDVTDAVDYAIKKPTAKSRQQELSKALETAGADKNQELVQLAEKLLAAVEKNSPKLIAGVGMDIGTLKAARLDVSKVFATQDGTGVKIENAEIEGDAVFSNIGGSTPKQ